MAFWQLAPEASSLWKSFYRLFRDFLFPRYCLTCGKLLGSQDLLLCPRCRPHLKHNPSPCPLCGLPYQGETPCPACSLEAPPFSRTLAPFLYAPPLSLALRELKYKKRIHLVREIAPLWRETAGEGLPADFLVCPVPLHRRRLLERGFNQSLLLARKIFGKKRVKELLVRHRATSPQAALPRKERLKNVKGAFRIRKGTEIAGRKILLFDDIFTTGATLRECAGVLLKAGAAEIRVAVVARAE